MAEITQYLYTNSGTELDFIQGIIDIICDMDDNITLEDINGNPTTVAAQYADLTSASQADFYLRFNDNFRLELKRGGNNSISTYNYSFKSPLVSRDVRFANAGKTPVTEWTRQYYVTYIKGANVRILYFGDYNVSALSGVNCSLIYLKDSGEVYVGHMNSNIALSANLYGDTDTLTYSALLPYAAEAGNIEYVGTTSFMSGGTKALTTSEIYSCSTINQFSSIGLPNGKNYFAIGTNALVEVDPST